jgi:hypothetical protein
LRADGGGRREDGAQGGAARHFCHRIALHHLA